MRPISSYVRLARDTRGAAQGWLCGGLLAVVGLGISSPGLGHDVQRLAAAAGLAPAPVFSLIAQ